MKEAAPLVVAEEDEVPDAPADEADEVADTAEDALTDVTTPVPVEVAVLEAAPEEAAAATVLLNLPVILWSVNLDEKAM